jgi:hypothetical protein
LDAEAEAAQAAQDGRRAEWERRGVSDGLCTKIDP